MLVIKTVGYDVGVLHDLVGVGSHDDPTLTPQRLRRPGYPLTYLKILAFFMTGRRNRIQLPCGSSTRAPLFLPATKFLALGEHGR